MALNMFVHPRKYGLLGAQLYPLLLCVGLQKSPIGAPFVELKPNGTTGLKYTVAGVSVQHLPAEQAPAGLDSSLDGIEYAAPGDAIVIVTF